MRLSLITLLGVSWVGVRAQKKDPTVFNGVEVPPLIQLTPQTHAEQLKAHTFWMVKHYSPYCHFCQDYAPTYQTAYEYYYTSQPEGTETSFSEFYDFKFGVVNCAAYDDLCVDLKVTSYPFTTLYKDGEEIDAVRGGKNITVVSNTIEAALEKEKPGSRPRFVAMPTPGATVAPKVSLATTTEEESTKEGSTKEESTKEKYTTKGESTPEGSIDLPVDMAPVKVESVEQNVIAMRQRPTPNPEGVSIPLTAEDFQTQITYTRRPWFVKFYAPWCHHCQALAPSWEQLAKQMKGRLNIGEVNCDKESRLCKEAGIRGFPTMYYFRGGEKAEYDGLRGLGDLQHYAEYALDLSGRVPDVDAKSLAELEEKEDVIFIYFYDHATVSEDFNALDRLPINLIGRARLVKTNDPELYKRYKITTWPRLAVSREGRPTYYTPLTPSHVRDVDGVLAWMREVWLPIVPELSASNAREIMDGKIVTLGILNRDNEDSFQAAVREMKSAATEWMDKQIQLMQMERQELRDAKQLRIEEAEDRNDQRALRQAKHIRISLDKSDRKEVTFAWVDAAFWQRWVRTTYGVDIKDGDRVIINDEDNRSYWDQTITGNNISPSRTSIMETLTKVTANPPKLKPKRTISAFEKVFFDIRMSFRDHPYMAFGGGLVCVFAAISWYRGRLRRTQKHFRLEDAMGIKELKEGFHGGNTNGNGKVD